MGDRLARSAWSAAKVGAFVGGLFLITLITRWHKASESPVAVLVIAVGITLLAFVTYFLFGALGYRIVGDELRAPRTLVWGFLFLLFVIAITVFGWLYATDRIPNHAEPPPAARG